MPFAEAAVGDAQARRQAPDIFWSRPADRPVALCYLSCNMRHMAVGRSERLVFEVEPSVKRALHARVAAEGRTLKDWLMERIDSYLHEPQQEILPFQGNSRSSEVDRDE